MYMETVPAFIENVQVHFLKLCAMVASNFLLVLEVRQRWLQSCYWHKIQSFKSTRKEYPSCLCSYDIWYNVHMNTALGADYVKKPILDSHMNHQKILMVHVIFIKNPIKSIGYSCELHKSVVIRWNPANCGLVKIDIHCLLCFTLTGNSAYLCSAYKFSI